MGLGIDRRRSGHGGMGFTRFQRHFGSEGDCLKSSPGNVIRFELHRY